MKRFFWLYFSVLVFCFAIFCMAIHLMPTENDEAELKKVLLSATNQHSLSKKDESVKQGSQIRQCVRKDIYDAAYKADERIKLTLTCPFSELYCQRVCDEGGWFEKMDGVEVICLSVPAWIEEASSIKEGEVLVTHVQAKSGLYHYQNGFMELENATCNYLCTDPNHINLSDKDRIIMTNYAEHINGFIDGGKLQIKASKVKSMFLNNSKSVHDGI